MFLLAVWLILVPLVATKAAEPFWRGWGYSVQPPANPQLGDGWLPTSHQNLRYWSGTHWEPVGGKWYKIASHTNDWWPPEGRVLDVEPGMPQALGFESWQAMVDDIQSPDGVIQEVGLQYDSNFGSEVTNWFESFPANGLIPEGYPYLDGQEQWFYFAYNRTALHANRVFVRLQGSQEAVIVTGPGPTTPVIRHAIGVDTAYDFTLALYVKI